MRIPDPKSANTSPDWIRHLFLHPIPLHAAPLPEDVLLCERGDIIGMLRGRSHS
jgi:hypothetical protein